MENVKPEAVEDDLSTEKSTTTWIVLFYKYHPLSPDPAVMEVYRSALENLCRSLQLKGRILVGCSSKSAVEGINGTLAGSYDCVRAFTQALLVSDKQQRQDQQHKQHSTQEARMNTSDSLNVQSAAIGSVVKEFQSKSREFFLKIGQAELRFESPDDFKWSSVTTKTRRENTDNDTSAIVNWSSNNDALHSTKGMEEEEEINDLFPDLRIKLVDELIGTGGALSHISLEETSLGYLTPKEWHQRLLACRNISHFRRATAMDPSSESQSSTTATQQVDQHDGSAQHLDSTCGNKKDDDQRAISNGDTVLIDCRNTKEYAIGHFAGAIDPQTTTFAQFPKWVDQNKLLLENKTVLMYCTGGIRCEKVCCDCRTSVHVSFCSTDISLSSADLFVW